MSLFGRALAGMGSEAVAIGNKYLDEELAQNRAQAIADIQRKTSRQIAEDADAFNSDPTRVARNRANRVADISAEGTARGDVELAARKKAATDQELLTADTQRAGALAGATASATAKANLDAEMKKITDPAWISAERKLALARHVESAGSIAQAQLANFQLGVAKNLHDLSGQLAEAQSSGNKDAADDIQSQIDAYQGKGGKVDKFYLVAEKTTAAMAQTIKVINDPMADPGAKAEAQATLRQQRMLLESAAKRAGVDLTSAAKVPEAQAVKEAQAALKAGAKLEDINARLREGGYQPLPEPPKKPGRSLMDIAAGREAGAPPAPPYEPPAGSPVADMRAKNDAAIAARKAAAESERTTKTAAAAQAYAAITPGSKPAAARLQASDLFSYLTPEQQRTIYSLVNGR